MDYSELIENLKNLKTIAYGYNINGEVFGMDCSDFEQIMVDAADALSKSIKDGDGTPIQKSFADVCVAGAPTVDAAPVVHGNWILEEVEFGISPITNEKVISPKYRCSNCGYETGKQAERFVCCPLCTARMRKDG